jgi:hypothetical protein
LLEVGDVVFRTYGDSLEEVMASARAMNRKSRSGGGR